MLTINLALTNQALYAGCQIEEVAGRLNLTTPTDEAINLVGRNIAAILESDDTTNITQSSEPCTPSGVVTLTGPMAVWSYLVVFHAVVHRFREVRYDDGRNPPVVIARHG